MPKLRTRFVCRACGSVLPRWLGRCPDCGAWDSLEEQRDAGEHRAEAYAEREVKPGAVRAGAATPIDEIDAAFMHARIPSGIGEFDRVLGGAEGAFGLVPGSAVLIGGEPGIGKSTLLLQASAAWADRLSASSSDEDWTSRVLYVSSEESAHQLAGRAERLELRERPSLYVLAETNLSRVAEQIRKLRPAVVVIDSVQMLFDPELDAAPGSVTQLRRCAADLVTIAKTSGSAVVMVGHVTKDGQLAGPRVLEHLVDAVLYFEGDRFHAGRIVRAIKNRFGTTMELGIFEMGALGLVEAPGSASVAPADPRPGSVACPAVHGSRCVMVEIQALTATGFLGAAKRKSSGLDTSRLAMVIAVLEQHAGVRLADRDIFASVVGGLRVVEPAADLALLLSIAGANQRRAAQARTCAVGEVGLGGELRPVPQLELRLREAAKLGFTRAIVPEGAPGTVVPGLEIDAAASVAAAIERLS